MDSLTQIQQMYLQLCWAVKLYDYLSDHYAKNELDKDQFDKELSYVEDQISLPRGQFDRAEDIIVASANNLLLHLGCYFITLDKALRKRFGSIKMDEQNYNTRENLRALIYMCRCAFAHDMLQPHWEVKEKYRNIKNVKYEMVSIDVDLSKYNQREFNLNDIGGYKTVMQIHERVEKLLAAGNDIKSPET